MPCTPSELSREECESVLSALRKEVELLERKLALLRKVIGILERVCGVEASAAEEVSIVKSRTTLRLAFRTPASKSNPYVKYILKVLSTLQRETEGRLDFSVEEVDDAVKSIVVTGLDKDTYDEVLAAMEYVARKLRGSLPSPTRSSEP